MLINKEELLKALQDDNGLQYPRWWYLEKVREMPEAVVRCKDCIYGEWDKVFTRWWCTAGKRVENDHFCGWGEKKDGANT